MFRGCYILDILLLDLNASSTMTMILWILYNYRLHSYRYLNKDKCNPNVRNPSKDYETDCAQI
jgi:hypothetical protein